jgi:hypothetical protein
MSTANPERAQQLINEGWALKDRIHVPSISLKTLAETAKNYNLNNPNLVSIDLEMVDFLEDLPSFLFQLRPQLVCLECVTSNVNLTNVLWSPESLHLNQAGYEPIAMIGGNIFAVPQQSSQTLSVFG